MRPFQPTVLESQCYYCLVGNIWTQELGKVKKKPLACLADVRVVVRPALVLCRSGLLLAGLVSTRHHPPFYNNRPRTNCKGGKDPLIEATLEFPHYHATFIHTLAFARPKFHPKISQLHTPLPCTFYQKPTLYSCFSIKRHT